MLALPVAFLCPAGFARVRRQRLIILLQHTLRRAAKIVILAVAHAPQERAEADQAKQDARGDQEGKDAYVVSPFGKIVVREISDLAY